MYEQPVTLRSSPPTGPAAVDLDWAAAVLWALYEAPLRPVIAEGDHLDPVARQQFLIGIVSLLWPDVVSRFAFAEAPTWSREVSDRSFDLQLTGRRGLSSIGRRPKEDRVVRASTRVASPLWARTAARELGRTSELPAFLRDAGPEAGDDRSAFGPLVDAWRLTQADDSYVARMPVLIDTLNRHFPYRRSMPRLKANLLGPPDLRLFFRDVPDDNILAVFVSEPSAECLSLRDMRTGDRAEATWRRDPEAALDVLRQIAVSPKTDHAHAYLRALAPVIPSEELEKLAKERPDLWVEIFEADRTVSERTKLARLTARESKTLVDAILRQHEASEADGERLRSLARASPTEWAEMLSAAIGSDTERIVNAIKDEGDLQFWAPVLPRAALARWARRSEMTPGQVVRLAEYFDPADARLIPSRVWRRAAAETDRLAAAAPEAVVTLLAAALADSVPPADTLAAAAFGRLWPNVRSDELDAHTKSNLLDVAGSRRTSDLGRSLAARISECFRVYKRWRVEETLLIGDLDAFSALLDYDSRQPGRAESLAYRLANQLPVDGMDIAHYERLQANLAKHARKDEVLGLFETLVRRLIRL